MVLGARGTVHVEMLNGHERNHQLSAVFYGLLLHHPRVLTAPLHSPSVMSHTALAFSCPDRASLSW